MPRIVSPTPLSRRKQEPGVPGFEYLPQPPPGDLFVWLGEADQRWIHLIDKQQQCPQVWYPDQKSLRSQSHLAGLMAQTLFSHGYAMSNSKRFLQGIRHVPRLVPWPMPPALWNCRPADGPLSPVLDLTCGQWEHTPQEVLWGLYTWSQAAKSTATVLHDKRHGEVARLLRRTFRGHGVRSVFITNNEERRLEYANHNLWLSFNQTPHLGALSREAQACSVFPAIPFHLQMLCPTCYTWRHKPFSRVGGTTRAEQCAQLYVSDLSDILVRRTPELLQACRIARGQTAPGTSARTVEYWRNWEGACKEQ